MSLNGMTLFKLSRRPPTIITVCHVIMLYCVLDDNVYPVRVLPFWLECPASSTLLYHGVGVPGWYWKHRAVGAATAATAMAVEVFFSTVCY